MSAFLDLLSVYAIWIYIAGAIGILFGIKMLADSRRMSRATMFTLEQEQAGDQAFRAIVVMIVFAALIAAVSLINTFIGPTRPTPLPVVAKQSTVAFTPVLILPTFTTVPTLTPQPATSTPTAPPTKQAQPTPVPQATIGPTEQPSPTAGPPTPAPAAYPQPNLTAPRDKESLSAARIQFLWGQDQLPSQLPPDQFYRVTIKYTDRNTNQPMTLTKCTNSSGIFTTTWPAAASAQGEAVNAQFTWSVVVMQVPGGNPSDCDAGAGSALSPVSATATFYWH